MNKYILLPFLLLFVGIATNAQEPVEVSPDDPEEIYMTVEHMPTLGPCTELEKESERKSCTNTEIIKFIAQNTRYPESAMENGIEGTVYVKYVVNKEGGVEQLEIMRGVSPELDQEALRVCGSLPTFEPGMQHGKKVLVQYLTPIKFMMNR